MAIIAILPVLGASTATPSTAEARLVPAAVRVHTITQITPIRMVRGRKQMIRSTSARKPALPAATAQRSTQTMRMRMATANVMTAAQLFR